MSEPLLLLCAFMASVANLPARRDGLPWEPLLNLLELRAIWANLPTRWGDLEVKLLSCLDRSPPGLFEFMAAI